VARYGEGRAYAAHTGSSNQDVTGYFGHGLVYNGSHDCDGWIARDGDLLHVDNGVFRRRR
jgi:hypothetical protein